MQHLLFSFQTAYQTHAADYHFAAFNAPPNVYSYSPDEYTNLLQDEDWTREETEYLFRLCQQYDLRFIVIHDRYDYPSARTPRSLEDLKARYYDCCRKLIAGRPAADEQAKNLAMNSYVFNKALEAHRKGYVRSLMGRTEEELEEERLLYVASRRLEQTYSRTVKEREHLLRTFGGPGSGAPRRENDITFLNNTTTGASQGPRLVGAAATAAANKAANANRATAKAASVAQVPADPAFDAQHCITRLEASGQVTLNSFGLPRSGVYSTGGPSVALRTARMPAVKPLLAPKIGEALAEMSLSSKLIMPTCANQEKLEALNAALSQLVELKRTVERAEYEVGVLERTTNPHATPAESEPPEGSSVPPVGGDTSMADESVEIPATQVRITSVLTLYGSSLDSKARHNRLRDLPQSHPHDLEVGHLKRRSARGSMKARGEWTTASVSSAQCVAIVCKCIIDQAPYKEKSNFPRPVKRNDCYCV